MSRHLPSLGGLRAFEATARCQSFVAAADELGVTAGAVSQQVKALEARLGLALFERRPQALVLTPAGRDYAPALKAAFDAIETATRRLVPPTHRIRLACAVPASFATCWLLPRLARFEAAHPEIELAILNASRRADPGLDGADAAIRQGRAGWREPACVYLFNEALVPVASPAHAAATDPQAGPADGATLLQAETTPALWAAWSAAHDRPLAPRRRLTLADDGLVIQAALNGIGVALVDRHLVESALREGKLVLLDDRPAWRPGTAWYLVHGERTPPLTAFAQWLLQESAGPMP
ncbi:MAG TPA: LysR substrate-binding domain-containing protein [Aliidongia sp.]|uniref:LysR substrate-binding domain-containing protein n=1 Tax=Aliidongia sp. TaxID=1914230 RepID=UPI002DDCBAF9|nr:LysR substrate-binding domain-containing protein [Aliidongia sp.]HEV2673985.1 LysR substrate-binding domain-containing protein [Aliidongia sp.]